MRIKNKTASFFALLIFGLMLFILYWSLHRDATVIIQAGHEGRSQGNTGAVSGLEREEVWNIEVADEVARLLKSWDISVLRVPAKVSFLRAKIAVSIHFDAAQRICYSGASIGYPNLHSYDFAQRWRAYYKEYFPFRWHQDNFTKNLKHYYAYHWIRADKFLLLELGELTCPRQRRWLKPRLKELASLIAYAIAKELGKEMPKPDCISKKELLTDL